MTRVLVRSLAAAAAFLAHGLATGAAAETRVVRGTQLVLSSTLSDDVTIRTSPGMLGQIRLTMTGSTDCLSVQEGRVATVSNSGCQDDSGRLWVDVPDDTPVTINSTGSGDIQVGDLRGPLVVGLSAGGNLVAGNAGALVVSIRGGGDVDAGQINGPLTVDSAGGGNVTIKYLHGALVSKLAGSGDLDIGSISADSAILQGYGSGNIKIGEGRIGNLHARFSGSSDLTVQATVGDADLEASGGSNITLARATGTLTKRATGGSDITVDGGSASSEAAEAARRGAEDARQAARQAEETAAAAMRSAERERDSALRSAAMASASRAMADARRQMDRVSTDADADDDEGSSDSTAASRTAVHMDMLHVLTAVFAAIVLFISYRIIRRAGGWPGLRRGGPKTPDVPTDPGVLALCETMSKLDQRLGRLEGYVTTREFDLNRKFRELGP